MSWQPWPKERTLKLIKEIERTNVWNCKSPEYKDQARRSVIFENIAQTFGCTRPEIETKWTNIKTQFSRENTKLRDTGCTEEDVGSHWYAYKHLLFLKRNPVQCNQYGNGNDNDELQQQQQQQLQQMDESNSSETSICKEETSSCLDMNYTERYSMPLRPNLGAIPKRKRRLEEFQPKTPERDEFDVFGEFIACELRKLKDPKYSEILLNVKRNITTELFNAEAKKFTAEQPSNFANSQFYDFIKTEPECEIK